MQRASKNKQTEPLGEYAGDTEPWEAQDVQEFSTPEVLDALAKLDDLPEDLAEAFETLKVSILTHKLEGWTNVEPKLIAAYLSEFKRLLVSKEN